MKVNGSLAFDASSASEIQNLRVQKYANAASFPTYTAADAGRMVYAIDSATLYYGTAGAWVPLATGGNAAALQTEVDAIETSLGSIVTTSGTFVVGQVTVAGQPSTATSLTGVLNEITAAMAGKDQLSELLDVNVTGVLTGDFLQYNGTSAKWEDHTLVLADVTDVTATAAEVNSALDGITSTAAELNVLHGVTGTSAADISSIAGYAAQGVTATEFGFVDATSSIQTQLNNKQPLDAGLSALAAFNTNGIIVQTADNVYAGRTITGPAAGIVVTNGDGVGGNPAISLANDLAALEGLTTTGYVVRTADGAATTRAIAGTAGNIVVTNGSGVASDTSLDLAAISQASSGAFSKVTLDGFGRVIGNTPVVTSDITALVDSTYVNATGDTMTGPLVIASGAYITLADAPTAASSAANKAYVDSVAQGLSWKMAVRAASTGNLTLSGLQTVDGIALVANDRVLVKDQTFAPENGIYVVASGAWVRAADMDIAAEFAGAAVLVQAGATQADFGYTETATVATVGFDEVHFAQFTGSSVLTAGVGLYQSANVLNVALGAGITELNTGNVGVDLYNAAGGNGALILTTDGATHSTDNASKLFLLLDSGSGLEQSITGLKISAAGVTNAMLAHSSITLNADAGTPGPLALGGTLQVIGTSAQGINTSLASNTITITAADASDTQKGVAKFDATIFSFPTSGEVSLQNGAITNAYLANNFIGLTGTTTAPFASAILGSQLVIVGATTPITTDVVDNTVTIAVADADTAAKGLASFNPAHFSVTAGAVSLAATLDDLTNVAGADTAGAGDLLTATGTGLDWVPVTRTALAGTINLGDLQDVGTAAPTSQYALIGDGTAWQAKKIFHVQNVTTAATTWTVTHGLGTQYCNVTVVDATDNVVIPQSIVFTSTTVVTVTFNTAIAGKLVVMGVA